MLYVQEEMLASQKRGGGGGVSFQLSIFMLVQRYEILEASYGRRCSSYSKRTPSIVRSLAEN